MTYQDKTGALTQGAHPSGFNGQDAYNDMLITERERESMVHDNGEKLCDNAEHFSGSEEQRLQRSTNSGGEKEYVVRRLTPTECARLQGFPDDWCADVPHSDAAEYRLWGNGIALPCLLPMMRAMAKVLKE